MGVRIPLSPHALGRADAVEVVDQVRDMVLCVILLRLLKMAGEVLRDECIHVEEERDEDIQTDMPASQPRSVRTRTPHLMQHMRRKTYRIVAT